MVNLSFFFFFAFSSLGIYGITDSRHVTGGRADVVVGYGSAIN